MTRVKICGVRDVEAATVAVEAGADLVGIVFAASKRRVAPDEARVIAEAVRGTRRDGSTVALGGPGPGEVKESGWFAAWNEAIEDGIVRWRPLVAGVFADQTVAEVNRAAEIAGLDLVQLSGGEDRDFIEQIERPVLRTVHVHPETDADAIFETAEPGAGAGIHLDTGKAGERGGTGATFDWAVAAEVAGRLPLMLAGGLRPENVGEAVAQVQPWAVDVSSGVETNGVKDHEKIRAFVRAAKGTRDGRSE